jgi:hypothetical protein
VAPELKLAEGSPYLGKDAPVSRGLPVRGVNMPTAPRYLQVQADANRRQSIEVTSAPHRVGPCIKRAPSGRSFVAMASVCVALLAHRSAIGDEAQTALENSVKASYLYNFAAHTEWPEAAFAGPDAPLIIGLVGYVPFAPALETGLRGKNLGGRKIVVRAVGTNDEAGRCHVLFIGAVPPERMATLLAAVAARPVLTVSETEGFGRRGGILNLYRGESSLKFEANPSAAVRMHLKLSSQLLKLARIVKDDAPPVKD